MNGKVIKTNSSKKFFAILLVISLVTSFFTVGFTASVDPDAVTPTDVVTDDVTTETETVDTDTVSAADTVTASDVPVVSESDLMMFAAAPAADDIASGTEGTCSWIIDAQGVLTIYPTDGTSGVISKYVVPSEAYWGWNAHCSKVKKVVVEEGVSASKSLACMFYRMTSCTEMDLRNLDTSNATNMTKMFMYNSRLTNLLIDSSFDTSNVTTMASMFHGCGDLTTLDLSNFNTSKVTNMTSMFDDCDSLVTLITDDSFDTSNVTTMEYMFRRCWGITNIDIKDWNTGNVKNMKGMFYNGGAPDVLDLSGWDVRNVTTMEQMFYQCSSLTELDVTGWKPKNVKNMTQMFYDCQSLSKFDPSGWDTSSLETPTRLFFNCQSLTELDLSGWDSSKFTDMMYMFTNCKKLEKLNLGSWTTPKVTAVTNMLAGCSALTELDISSFDTSNWTYMNGMFNGCSSLTELDVSNFDTSKTKYMFSMFSGCSGLTELDVSNFNTSSVVSMSGMFSGCSGLTELDLRNFNTANVEYTSSMFSGCKNLKTLKIKDGFVTSNVLDMESMFNGCSSLTSINLTDWDTSNVTITRYVFLDCSSLTSLDLSSWNIQKVTDGRFMFGRCSNLNEYTVGTGWCVVPKYDSYDSFDGVNFFNVVDDELVYTPKEGYAIKSLTIDGEAVDFDVPGGKYADFTDGKVAVIRYAPALTVTFMDSTDDSIIDTVPVAQGNSVTAPTIPGVLGWATEKGGTTEADLSNVTGDMTVWTIYRDTYTGTPSVVFDKESKTFDKGEVIKFKAVGYWADSSTSEFIDGDERYVPTNWHHAEPSGDFGGKTAPTDTYSASFKQSEAGTYTLKVEFAKSVYADGAWVDDGIVTVETEYKVVAPSAGDTDVPKTGDSSGNMILITNIMLICAAGMYFTWRTLKKKENA